MVHHIAECGEAPVVVEAVFLMCEESFQRCCPVTFVGCTIRLHACREQPSWRYRGVVQ